MTPTNEKRLKASFGRVLVPDKLRTGFVYSQVLRPRVNMPNASLLGSVSLGIASGMQWKR